MYSEEENNDPIDFEANIRQRPSSYIGALGSTGKIFLLKLVLVQCVEVSKDTPVFVHVTRCIRDVFNIVIESEASLEELNGDRFKLGVDFLALNAIYALSEDFQLNIENGKLNLEFRLDEECLGAELLDWEYFTREMKQFAVLNKYVDLLITDKTGKYLQQHHFHYPNGIIDLTNRLRDQERFTTEFELWMTDQLGEHQVNFYIGFKPSLLGDTRNYPKVVYANDVLLVVPGSIREGIITGVIGGIRQVLRQKRRGKEFMIQRKAVVDDLFIIATIRSKKLNFSETNNGQLDMEELEQGIEKVVKAQTINLMEDIDVDSFLFGYLKDNPFGK